MIIKRKVVIVCAVLILIPILGMGCMDGGNETVEVRIDYAGYWSGTIEDGNSVKEVYGIGFERFSVTSSEITVFVEKGDGGGERTDGEDRQG